MLKLSIISAGLSVVLFYVYSFNYGFENAFSGTNYFKDFRQSVISYSEDFIRKNFFKETSSEELFSLSELSEFDGVKKKELYLSILGNVFDVSKGQSYYGAGGSYHFFVGKDASRAFATGALSEQTENDGVLDLPPQDVKSIVDWVQFYHKSYPYKGKLKGRFYDESGNPTDYNFKVQGVVEKVLSLENSELEEKKKFPPCNVEWSENVGTRVWCTKKSGGIERNWVGVPRKLYTVGAKDPRCACVDLRQFEEDIEENEGEKGETRSKNLEEYKGCDPRAASCFVIN